MKIGVNYELYISSYGRVSITVRYVRGVEIRAGNQIWNIGKAVAVTGHTCKRYRVNVNVLLVLL